jgi:hypothetical protein
MVAILTRVGMAAILTAGWDAVDGLELVDVVRFNAGIVGATPDRFEYRKGVYILGLQISGSNQNRCARSIERSCTSYSTFPIAGACFKY